MANARRTHVLTESQSRALRWPITFSSERCAVSTHARKQDSARSPENRQSRRNVICCARGIRQLRGENSKKDICAFGEVGGARDHNRRADLRLLGADEAADHNVARLQSRSSDPWVSRRRRDAALKSFRSSSDQESDQSMIVSERSVANRSAGADNSIAVSEVGGGRRLPTMLPARLAAFPCSYTQYRVNILDKSSGFRHN